MNNNTKKGLIAVLVVFLILLLDQLLKIWVKTTMSLSETIDITSWFKLHFVENRGMAFGIEAFGKEAFGKLSLSLFRIAAVVAIAIYLTKLVRQSYKMGFIVCIALILAGASGNIIDSVFYGEFFSASTEPVVNSLGNIVVPGQVATFVPLGEGYSSWLHGKVVDMLYFPLINTTLPDWVPIWGGEKILFFRFIFNVADSAITVGVLLLLFFYRKTLSYSLLSKSEREKLEKEKLEKENDE
ncbi:MAG: lipoprotein signal peptidase [Dysgonamonadaceae bacterium]|jgi:signal peptidase II|nr:lipoprotein signal peptidase [Dysgonamonadaceae bacterium]